MIVPQTTSHTKRLMSCVALCGLWIMLHGCGTTGSAKKDGMSRAAIEDILPSPKELTPEEQAQDIKILTLDPPAEALEHRHVFVVRHEVIKGDTLYNIARRYGTNVTTLAAHNHLEDPSQIRIGQVLVIPKTGSQNGP